MPPPPSPLLRKFRNFDIILDRQDPFVVCMCRVYYQLQSPHCIYVVCYHPLPVCVWYATTPLAVCVVCYHPSLYLLSNLAVDMCVRGVLSPLAVCVLFYHPSLYNYPHGNVTYN